MGMKKVENNRAISIVHSNGYTQKGYGYRMVTKTHTHWITFFNESIQMYSYYSNDLDLEKIYDTGLITVNNSQLQILIDVWLKNYN